MAIGRQRTATAQIPVAASPAAVWSLVSDLPNMGRFSPENTGGQWLDGASAPVIGARFRGDNRRGWRRWRTVATVRLCEPGRALAFDVASLGLPVATWRYDIAPRPDGCEVTETWSDRRSGVMVLLGRIVTGVADRAQAAAESMQHTLAAVRAEAERSSPPGAGSNSGVGGW